jgi:hypothetical protein
MVKAASKWHIFLLTQPHFSLCIYLFFNTYLAPCFYFLSAVPFLLAPSHKVARYVDEHHQLHRSGTAMRRPSS